MSSATELTLKRLRELGFTAQVVEKWNPHARIRQDLFGFIDVLAVGRGVTMGVQCCTSRVAERVRKITEHPNLPAVREADWSVQVWGWTRNKKGRYVLRVVDIS